MVTHLDEIRNLVTTIQRRLEGTDSAIVRLPASAALDVKRFIANRTEKEIKRIVPVRTETIEPRGFDLQLWRQLAARGLTVSRMYIVPHVGFAKDRIAQCLEEDQKVSIQSRVITVSKVTDPDLYDFFNGVGLWGRVFNFCHLPLMIDASRTIR